MDTSPTTAGPRFKGQPIDLGDRSFVVPPLALGAVKDLLPRLQKITTGGGLPSADDMDTMVDAAHAAIARNYPEVTREELLELIDLGNIRPVFRMIMGISGFEPSSAGTEGNGAPGAATP